MKPILPVVALSLFLAPVAGCDGGEKKSIAEQIGPATKDTKDLKANVTVSEEELQRRRKEAGFKSKAEIDAELAAENAKAFAKGDREYVKNRLKDYRKLTAETRKVIDDIEKETAKWSAAKDPQKAFDKSGKALAQRAKDQQKALDKLSGPDHASGGNTLVILNKAFRPLAEVIDAFGPELGKQETFAATLTAIRAALDEADADLTSIEKDETLFVKDGEDAKGEGDAKGAAGAGGDDKAADPKAKPKDKAAK